MSSPRPLNPSSYCNVVIDQPRSYWDQNVETFPQNLNNTLRYIRDRNTSYSSHVADPKIGRRNPTSSRKREKCSETRSCTVNETRRRCVTGSAFFFIFIDADTTVNDDDLSSYNATIHITRATRTQCQGGYEAVTVPRIVLQINDRAVYENAERFTMSPWRSSLPVDKTRARGEGGEASHSFRIRFYDATVLLSNVLHARVCKRINYV